MPDPIHFARKYAENSEWQYQRGLQLLELAAPVEGRAVVDLGCGTGQLTMELARRVGNGGSVIAVDPDAARLREAAAARTPEVTNLELREGQAQDVGWIEEASIDLVFSNYAVHWVLDHATMLREVERILKPGGRFVAEFVGETPSLFYELLLLMPDGEQHVQDNAFRKDQEWRTLISARKLETVRWDWLSLSLDFENLTDLYQWLEGTSHGRFEAKNMAPAAAADFEARFPGPASAPVTALRMVLERV
ncbi:MAG: methyltransferase domain-containing protein [Myxococcota bacterium]